MIAALGIALSTSALGACSIAMTPSDGWRAVSTDDVTGSIHKPAPELTRGLDAEDQRRAIAALGTALDPQGAGGSVNWDNSQSGAKGSFTPVGPAYPIEGKICRAFVADVSTRETQERLQGAACREKTAEWSLSEVKPWHKG
ncbi:RT0821/Lpp0805 family surface protein [Methylocystis heyeri]|nr:RT0821/Lpp0805 family surface protein [Methylocystis heyeri]